MKGLGIVFLGLLAGLLAQALPAVAQESVIYSFPDEATGDPVGRLLLVNGALYGATTGASATLGTVFELKKTNSGRKETTVHTFGGSDGRYPAGGLIADANGVLYGTTSSGGTYNGGTFFSLTRSGKTWTEQTLWNFGNPDTKDSVAPACELLMDASGAVYGTAQSGGAHNMGTVFRLTSSGGVWTSTVLYSFAGGRDGTAPHGGVTMDSAGVLYGTTYYGGAENQGTAFALTPSGNKWNESVLYAFGKNTDGRNPCCEPLVLYRGDLYGTTLYGGANDWGIVFELIPSGAKWKEKIVHTFGSGSDGRTANGGVMMGKSGTLYGTTINGGQNSGGTVYQLVHSGGVWTETVDTNFANFNGDGFFPQGGVTLDSRSGTLYGTTDQGGAQGWGAVYQIVQ